MIHSSKHTVIVVKPGESVLEIVQWCCVFMNFLRSEKANTVPHVLQTRSMGFPDLLQRVVRRAVVLQVHLAAFLPTEGPQRGRDVLCVLRRRHRIKSRCQATNPTTPH